MGLLYPPLCDYFKIFCQIQILLKKLRFFFFFTKGNFNNHGYKAKLHNAQS